MLNKYSDDLNNSERHLSNAVIATYISFKNNLSKKEIFFIENHLSKCNECNSKLNEMEEEDLEIDEERNSKITRLQDYKIGKNQYYIWATAAMIIVALSIGIYYLLLPEEKVIVQNDKPIIDSLKADKNVQDIREPDEKETEDIIKDYNEADFAVNNVLENFVNRNMRSANNIKTVSPEIGDTLSIPISFEWEKGTKDLFIFELVNNRNKIVAKETLAENNFSYKKKLDPGLYYWKLLIDDKLDAVGKFYIK